MPLTTRSHFTLCQHVIVLLFSIIFLTGSQHSFTLEAEAATWSEENIQAPEQIIGFDCQAAVQMSSNECNTLLALYQHTNGENWKRSTNWQIHPNPCSWYGILCSEEGSVLSISLGSNNLTGQLPDKLQELKSLRMLGLWNNRLSGSIPAALGKLTELGILDLSNNNLNGTIPQELGDLTKLNTFWLSDNGLTGVVPVSLTALKNLTSLHLERNLLSGKLPSGLFELQQIEEFEFGYNAIETPTSIYRTAANAHSLQTQTVPPEDLHITEATSDSVLLVWTPIEYQGDDGFYGIGYRTKDEQAYTAYPTTVAKNLSMLTIKDLSPSTTYDFAIRTYTPPHQPQANAIWSSYSKPITQTTAATLGTTEILTSPVELTITALEVTQGIQNLTNDMPLVADRLTWVRVYAQSELADVADVRAQLRAFKNGEELMGSPLAMKYDPITVRTDGGSRLNLDDSFQFELPTSWLTGTVTFRAELNHDFNVVESDQNNNHWEETVVFQPSAPLSLVMVPVKLHKEGDSEQPAKIYTTADSTFESIIANSYRYMPVSVINWREHDQTLEADCDGLCNIESYTDPTRVLEQLESMRLENDQVSRFYETANNEHWVGMVDSSFLFGGLGIRPQKSFWQSYSAWSSISSIYPATYASPYEIGGSLAMMHEIGHNLGMMHIDCHAGESNVAPEYPYGATTDQECSLDEIDESGFYGFDVYYQAAGMQKPLVISNNPLADQANSAYPMMSYKFPGWTSPYKYCQLLIKFDVACDVYTYDSAVHGTEVEPLSTIDLEDVHLLQERQAEDRNNAQESQPIVADAFTISRSNNRSPSSGTITIFSKRITEVDQATGETAFEVVDIQDATHGYVTSNGQMLYYVSKTEQLSPEVLSYTVKDKEGISQEFQIEVGAPVTLNPPVMLPIILNN